MNFCHVRLPHLQHRLSGSFQRNLLAQGPVQEDKGGGPEIHGTVHEYFLFLPLVHRLKEAAKSSGWGALQTTGMGLFHPQAFYQAGLIRDGMV